MSINRNKFLLLFVISSIIVSCTGLGPQPPTPQPVTLRFAYLGREADYQTLAEQFHATYPHITVNLIPISYFQSNDTLDRLRAQFKEADVVRSNVGFLGPDQLAVMRPLDEFLTNDKDIKRDDVFPGLLAAMQHMGEQLGLPAGIDPMVTFYENMRFKIAKTTPPGADYTLDNFLAAAKDVNNQNEADKTSGKFTYGFCTTPLGNDPFTFAYLFGGKIFDRFDNPTKPTLDDPANVEAIEWYASLWSEHNVTPPVSDNPNEIFRYFASSLCGFWMQYYDMIGILQSYLVEPHMLPLPKVKAPFSFASVDGYYLTVSSSHPQEAWQWMSFLLQHQEASGMQIPPLVSQIASDDYAKRVSPEALAIARGLPHDTEFYRLSVIGATWVVEINDLFSQAVKQVVEGKADARAALEEAQKQAEKIFAEKK
jgi:multiple sugar transport system substrate-binding protein